MKKVQRLVVLVLVLATLGVSFAGVGGHTRKTGGRQSAFSICQLNAISTDSMQVSQCDFQ
jgi:hypothetical protein